MTKQIEAYLVNAFLKDNSGGSPTGVILKAPDLTDDEMQIIANRIPASHTAFIFEPRHEKENVKVRFFTPGGEIPNCGHGTIAVHYSRAKVFNYTGSKTVLQQAKEGVQQIEIVKGENDFEIYFRQNEIKFTTPSPLTIQHLLEALSVGYEDMGKNYPVTLASPGSGRFLLAVQLAETINAINPDFEKLKLVCDDNKSMGCFVYSVDKLSSKLETEARMFAPAIGINEDVVNGNSSGCLGAYLLRLGNKDSLTLKVIQGQKFNLTGLVKVKAKRTDGHIETVIGGKAKIEREFTILLP